jgi:hypothetical protein
MGARVFVLNHDILGKDAARINLFVVLHIGLAGFCAWSTLFAGVSHLLYFTLRCLLEIELRGRLVSLVSQVPSDYSNLYRQLDTTSSNFY